MSQPLKTHFKPLPVGLNSELADSVALALRMQGRAHCPYSRFPVGAAIQSVDGSLFGGCNIENVSFSLTNCAERVAAQRAVADGNLDWKTLVIASNGAVYPCGACRQVLLEFAPRLEIWLVDTAPETPLITTQSIRLDQLLPAPFATENLPAPKQSH